MPDPRSTGDVLITAFYFTFEAAVSVPTHSTCMPNLAEGRSVEKPSAEVRPVRGAGRCCIPVSGKLEIVGPIEERAIPQGLKPRDFPGCYVRAEARTLHAEACAFHVEACTLQTGLGSCGMLAYMQAWKGIESPSLRAGLLGCLALPMD